MPRASRSTSRGRAAPKSPASAKKKTPAKKAAAAAAPAKPAAMAFDEGDQVMARWPGTQLFFKVRKKLIGKNIYNNKFSPKTDTVRNAY